MLICSSCSENPSSKNKLRIQKGEYINRLHHEHLTQIPDAQPATLPFYSWEENHVGKHLKITKDFFRCKGTAMNPVQIVEEKGELIRYYDCGGTIKHSLPLRNQKEFVYPILIELLNYIQNKTQHRVVITSGHRCPDHNAYVDSTLQNRFSKHMIGAEVSFYVEGLESRPENIVKVIQQYYHEHPKSKEKKEYCQFERYEKGDLNVSVPPWYNKEIFIKIFKKSEGRNFDNRHPYPYLSIQVRYDEELKARVAYDWEKAVKNYLRY